MKSYYKFLKWLILSIPIIILFTWSFSNLSDLLAKKSALNAAYGIYGGIDVKNDPFIVELYDNLVGYYYFKKIGKRITKGLTSDEDKIKAIAEWTFHNIRPIGHIPDNFFNIARRGYGLCDHSAHVFSSLAFFMGYPSRQLYLRNDNGVSPHSVAEVYVKGKWCVVDTLNGIVYQTPNGKLMSINDLKRNMHIYKSHSFYKDIPIRFLERGTPLYIFPYGTENIFKRLKIEIQRLTLLNNIAYAASGQNSFVDKKTENLLNKKHQIDKEVVYLFDRARKTHLLGEYKAAFELYNKILKIYPQNGLSDDSQYFLAFCLYNMKSYEQSIIEFSRLKKKFPSSPWISSAELFIEIIDSKSYNRKKYMVSEAK